MDYEKERINGLIEQLQNGDKAAFDEFYKLTSPKAYFIALKITRNEHDAEDILQESYIKALEKLDEIDTSQNAMSWFCKIVANKSKDLIKGKKPLVFEGEDDAIFEDIPEDKTEFCPEENLNQEEIRLEVMAAIDELTAEKRACIMMMYFGEMSVKEIAESIEVPESTVKNRLYTARKDLRTKFEKSGSILHGAAIGGVIIWALQKTSVTASASFVASAASAEILAGIGASAGYSAVTTAAAAAPTAATTAAAAGTGIAAKVAALSIIQKVAVGIAATAVVGGGAAGVVTVVKTVTDKPEPTTLAEEVTTASLVTSEHAFNEIVVTADPTNQETSMADTSATLESTKAMLTERSTKPSTSAKPTTTKPHTTQKPTTTQRETSTQKETTTRQATSTRTETTTQRVTTTKPATMPTTVPTTVPTTQAAATVTVDIIDMDGSVVETLSFSVPAGTTLTKEYIIDSVRTKNYEPMAGVYGDIDAVAQGGQTYHFEAEL